MACLYIFLSGIVHCGLRIPLVLTGVEVFICVADFVVMFILYCDSKMHDRSRFEVDQYGIACLI